MDLLLFIGVFIKIDNEALRACFPCVWAIARCEGRIKENDKLDEKMRGTSKK